MLKNIYVKIGIGVVGVFVFLVMVASCAKGKINKNTPVETPVETAPSRSTADMSDYEREQIRLIKKYGEAGDGFRWSEDGKLVALGDPNLSDTEVLYTYIRSLSTLDFATAERYAYKDRVLKSVDQFYSTDATNTYDTTFKKNMYQQVLLSLEPVRIESVASFASGKTNVTMIVNVLDLTNKDFWREDQEDLFTALQEFKSVEGDTTKARLFLYDYVLSYWKSEYAEKREFAINFVLETTGGGGYLVTGSDELDAIARYTDGESVVNNIHNTYMDSRR